jgi:radical SAM protein with 4Fe4S-binding SPASM domain
MFLTIAHGNAADDPSLILQPYMLLDVFEEVHRVIQLCERNRILFFPGNNLGYFGPYEHEIRHRQGHGFYTGCTAGKAGAGIEADGSIKACPSLGGPQHTGGSIREHSLRDIWERAPEMLALGDRTVDDLWGWCRTCYYADTCKAGCTATAEPLFGRPGNNPFCHHRVQQLDAQGLRERIERVAAASNEPFGMGRFRLIVEHKDAERRSMAGPVEVMDPRTDL